MLQVATFQTVCKAPNFVNYRQNLNIFVSNNYLLRDQQKPYVHTLNRAHIIIQAPFKTRIYIAFNEKLVPVVQWTTSWQRTRVLHCEKRTNLLSCHFTCRRFPHSFHSPSFSRSRRLWGPRYVWFQYRFISPIFNYFLNFTIIFVNVTIFTQLFRHIWYHTLLLCNVFSLSKTFNINLPSLHRKLNSNSTKNR